MPTRLPVMIEMGPKRKRVVALAPDWPGLERGAKTEGEALERLASYLGRYARVAERAGLAADFPADGRLHVTERFEGRGSTDFWGISFAPSPREATQPGPEELERQLSLLEAAWAEFDATGKRVSATLAKGPRGGGRDRDEIIRHVLANEAGWAKSTLGVAADEGANLTAAGLLTHRAAYVEGIRARRAEPTPPRKWPIAYLIRHTAYHALDHAWEMEDRDLSDARA